MVMLRSGWGGSSRPGAGDENDGAAAAATPTTNASRRRRQVGPSGSFYEAMETSSVFLSLDSPSPSSARSKRRNRSGAPRGGPRASEDFASDKECEHFTRHSVRAVQKNNQHYSDSSFGKSMAMLSENGINRKHFTRQLARLQADNKKNEACEEGSVIPVSKSLRPRVNAAPSNGVEENGDVEVRRSCRIRRSRYSTMNQSVLFDKLITNTAEAVLQKMDDMKKMRRRRMMDLEDLGVFNDAEAENLDVYSCGKTKRGIQRIDEETTDNQDGSAESSEGEDQEDEDGEDNRKRYDLRKRKTVVRYQASPEKPRHQRKPKLFYPDADSAVRRRFPFSPAGPRSPFCKKMNRRKHAIHNTDSTSSSSSDDEQHFERRRKRSLNKALSRCLPLNLRKDDLKGIHKDRMKIGASLADVDPMQIDCSVRFDSVGGLSSHISALKEMVVFPLLYPEVFERFKIQPPRGCLFYGPPGTGKTLVARALANECTQGDRRIAFFMRKGADCLSKWVGESERQLRLLFDQAYQMRPSIIFFDEIDGLAPVRSSRQDQIHSSIVSTLLALMDGLDSRGEIVVIGATNRLDAIDPALRRPGRFDREFLFTLPDKDARREILKIHTREWSPKPSEMFLEELAEKCVGYCGADIKSICTEAALCALRRRYPQIYTSSAKLQLDISSINITAKDFVVAMQKTTPASQRAVSSPGQALSTITKPLLENTLRRILETLRKVFPHAELAQKSRGKPDFPNDVLDNDMLYSDEEGPFVFEAEHCQKMSDKQKENTLNFNRSAYHQPTTYRPRLLIAGEAGFGQASHLAPAVIHALEKFTVYTLDLSVLFGVGAETPEEKCTQLISEAKRTAPSIIYVPNVHLWWETVGHALQATFTTLLQNIPSFAPVLLLATSDVYHADLPEEVQVLFAPDYGEIFNVCLPTTEERKKFFEDLILHQAAKTPASKKKAVLQALEVLPVAPSPELQQLTEAEVKRLEEQEEDTLRELRIFLRNVTHRLAIDKRFRVFTKPVDLLEVPDYVTVIKQPMDLSAIISKIDLHQYLTAKDYLKDIDLICSNALEYNPDRDPGDRLIRHRACSLKDTAYAIVKEEMDEDFEQLCEEIQEYRKKRGCSSAKYAPSYYYVMPKQNATLENKKLDSEYGEKLKSPSIPVESGSPSFSNALSKRKLRRKSRWCLGNLAKRKKISHFNKENKAPGEEQDEPDSDVEDCLENDSSMEQSEIIQTSLEEVDMVLPEQQTSSCESKSDAGNESEQASGNTAKSRFEEGDKDTECSKKNKRCNGDPIEHSSDKDTNDTCVLRMTRARRSQVEQQHLISVEKAMEILSEQTPPLIVDYEKLNALLQMVVEKSENYTLFQLEKLYALLSQCIYQHRCDYDKTKLIQAMEREITVFN
ncbi:ATPase family AAA domain-containing protein 2 [Heteronotia binoei]|uniref:ATPase family AAA domain-containing protein 2 n=1 Tax=Heteronotia binoei TaxID=13085 RepID=UPI00292D5C2E|nr:ATPase family AAA domain-containing protein 2 [Heteronotia binoei]XP_060099236.1 ATPase family AAA domain-containing protein 2 [Heteronotia binoei]